MLKWCCFGCVFNTIFDPIMALSIKYEHIIVCHKYSPYLQQLQSIGVSNASQHQCATVGLFVVCVNNIFYIFCIASIDLIIRLLRYLWVLFADIHKDCRLFWMIRIGYDWIFIEFEFWAYVYELCWQVWMCLQVKSLNCWLDS